MQLVGVWSLKFISQSPHQVDSTEVPSGNMFTTKHAANIQQFYNIYTTVQALWFLYPVDTLDSVSNLYIKEYIDVCMYVDKWISYRQMHNVVTIYI